MKKCAAEAEVRMVWSVALKLEKGATAKKTGWTLRTEIGKELDFFQDFLKEETWMTS